MSFKIGDKIRVRDDRYRCPWNLGKVLTIVEIENVDVFRTVDGCSYASSQIVLVPDLKVGQHVRMLQSLSELPPRNGCRLPTFDDEFHTAVAINSNGDITLDDVEFEINPEYLMAILEPELELDDKVYD